MAERKTEGQWVNGKWVNTGISAVKGSDDTSATTKAKLQDVTGLAAAARKAKEAREKAKATPTPKPVSSLEDDPAEMARRSLRARYGGGTLGSMMRARG